tara:strand:- start:69842 stop:70117 length:276 start_codon:yes stop_codon:yes gene_type:complete
LPEFCIAEYEIESTDRSKSALNSTGDTTLNKNGIATFSVILHNTGDLVRTFKFQSYISVYAMQDNISVYTNPILMIRLEVPVIERKRHANF